MTSNWPPLVSEALSLPSLVSSPDELRPCWTAVSPPVTIWAGFSSTVGPLTPLLIELAGTTATAKDYTAQDD